jgi:PEP-CTERM motif
MRKINLIATAAFGAASLTASAANAQVTPTFTDGTGGLPPGEVSIATFDPASDNGGVTGTYIIQSGSNANGADPAVGDQGDNYLSVLGGNVASFDFTGFAGGGLSLLSLDYGSADSYNLFTLLLSGGATAAFTGQDLINIGTADGDQSSPRTNGRLTFTADAGTVITGLTLSSTQNSLESDNYAAIAAVPEPATWAMMLLGFGAIGIAARRTRKTSLAQLA